MSDSSDEGEPFQLRDFDEDSEDERPNKRRKTMRPLRGRGLGFVKSATAEDGQQEEEEDDVDDERPAMGGFRNSFNIGEFPGDMGRRNPVSNVPTQQLQQPEQSAGSGPSAFGKGGRIQKNSFAARMMEKQGYVEGQGLGKTGQGITAPIQAKVLQSRAGLGVGGGSAEPPSKKQTKAKEKGKASQSSTPGTSTPRLKPPPKAKYAVAAIESRGLHIPEAMKSIIVDATGAETRTVTSLSGFSTPTRELSPVIEAAKATSRIKMQLQAYADAWDATKEQETHLHLESAQLEAAHTLHMEEISKYQDLILGLERVALDDSNEPRDFDQMILRLQEIQEKYSDDNDDLDLAELTASCLEGPFRKELVNWDSPLTDPAPRIVELLQSIGVLLDLDRSTADEQQSLRYRKRTTPFESLLLLHWFPLIRTALKSSSWNIYHPDPAVALITAWTPLLPPWLQYKILNDLVLPRLIDGVRRFPKLVDQPCTNPDTDLPSSHERKKQIPPSLQSWLFPWWTMLSSDELDLESFPILKSLVKSKVDSGSWPDWKPLLGSKRAVPSLVYTSQARVGAAGTENTGTVDEITFKDLVEEWCSENNLILHSSHRSDAVGRLLYRLQDAERRSKGLLVSLHDDVVFGEDGEPYALDGGFVARVLGR